MEPFRLLYALAELDALLDDRSLVEYQGVLRPGEDMSLYRAEMQSWPGREPLRDWQVGLRQWLEANDACRRGILQLLQSEGPLPARELPDTCVVPADEARAIRDRRRLASLGVARAKGPMCPVEPLDVGAAGEPAVIDGVRGTWRVDPERLGQPFRGRAALLSPLDRLVVDRKRVAEIFEFDYYLEMYKPAAQRRWGYYALPILYGDRLVGKLDAAADDRAGVLRINATHEDLPFTKAMRAAIDREIRDLAQWLELEVGYGGGA